jgi:hypothetical protein
MILRLYCVVAGCQRSWLRGQKPPSYSGCHAHPQGFCRLLCRAAHRAGASARKGKPKQSCIMQTHHQVVQASAAFCCCRMMHHMGSNVHFQVELHIDKRPSLEKASSGVSVVVATASLYMTAAWVAYVVTDSSSTSHDAAQLGLWHHTHPLRLHKLTPQTTPCPAGDDRHWCCDGHRCASSARGAFLRGWRPCWSAADASQVII